MCSFGLRFPFFRLSFASGSWWGLLAHNNDNVLVYPCCTHHLFGIGHNICMLTSPVGLDQRGLGDFGPAVTLVSVFYRQVLLTTIDARGRWSENKINRTVYGETVNLKFLCTWSLLTWGTPKGWPPRAKLVLSRIGPLKCCKSTYIYIYTHSSPCMICSILELHCSV